MAKTGLRARLRPQLWLGLFSLLGILGLAIVDVRRTAPGPVTAVHARINDLAGGDNCRACHGGWGQSMTAACLDCHTAIEAQQAQGVGVHGMLVGAHGQRCATCHPEHHGSGFKLVSRTSFALAGVPDPEQFDHARIGWPMEGKHLEQSCAACHEHAYAEELPVGGLRFLGISPACAQCHDDPHAGDHGDDCAACHVQTGFETPHFVGHEKFLPLVGGHAGLSCSTCHPTDNSRHSLAALRAPGLHRDQRDCGACHASPHRADFSKGSAALLDNSISSACVDCHLPEHTGWSAAEALLSSAAHSTSGFALNGPHQGLTCGHCHNDPSNLVQVPRQGRQPVQPAGLDAEALQRLSLRRGQTPAALPRSETNAFDTAPDFVAYGQRFPGRQQDQCSACHQDPHAGQFAALLTNSGPYDQAGCLACHARESFAFTAYGIEQHRHAGLPLDGQHAQLDCAACHPEVNGRPALTPRRAGIEPPTEGPGRALWPELANAAVAVWLEGLDPSCAACHADAHQGYFAAAGQPAAASTSGACSACHTTESFSHADAGPFDHDQHTRFALEGAHAEAVCQACHAPRAAPDEHGRSFGSVAERFGRFNGCQTCHQDPHGGAFAKWGSAEAQGAGQSPLDEFSPGTDCSQCHSSSSFRHGAAAFDHGAHTGFALTGAHAEAACSSCHAPSQLSQRPARQRPGPEDPLAALGLFPSATPQRQATTPARSLAGALGQACADCHGDAHAGQFAVDGVTDCADCHSSTTSFRELSFDHQVDSIFPLEGAHLAAACAACHKPEAALAELQSQPNSPGSAPAAFSPVRYKPLGTSCTTCHAIQPGPLRRGN
jgi:Doubled CXXCH motif (Paired_CXXCH_1)